MSDKFTIKQLYSIAENIALKGTVNVLKKEDFNRKNFDNLLQNLIIKQAIERNKLRKKKISVLIKIYTEEEKHSISDTIDKLINYLNDETKLTEIKGKLLTKKEAQCSEEEYKTLIEDIKDYLCLYDSVKTIDEVNKNTK